MSSGKICRKMPWTSSGGSLENDIVMLLIYESGASRGMPGPGVPSTTDLCIGSEDWRKTKGSLFEI